MVKTRGSRSRLVTTLRWTGLLVGAVVLLAVAALAGYRAVTLPDRSGSIELAGLRAPVEVLRDRHGVAHIRAANELDAFFALGHAHATDRLWQLEMNRRIVAGRLAEVLGPAALTTDRVLRVLGVRHQAAEVWAELDPATREILQAYVDGINAGADEASARPWKLSPEFLILGVRPGKWEPVDAIGWATMMAWDLSANLNTELLRAALWPRLGTERLSWLLDTDPVLALPDRDNVYADPVRLASGGQPAGNPLAAAAALGGPLHAMLQAAFPSAGNDGIGSNNWVIDASRSLTGGALLANDPHLALGAPALWYLAHLSAPGLEVIGATLPGLPYVVLGRTERTAWGFTNTSPDSQDLYLERLDPADAKRYRTPEGWAAFETRSETIAVRGQGDVQLTVRSTRHGPVISDALPTARQALTAAGQDAGYVLALRWTALEPGDRTIRAGIGMNRASDWAGFEAALRDFHAPQQNIVFADRAGTVAMIAPGRVPVRKPGNLLHGLAPAPGWDARYDWDGYLAWEQLPRVVQPANGVIVTANQRMIGVDPRAFIGAEFSRPERYDRIQKLLAAKPRHDLASFAAIQADVSSGTVAEILPLLLKTEGRSALGRRAMTMLRAWAAGGERSANWMGPDRPEPLIALAWIDRLRQAMFVDEVGSDLFAQLDTQRSRYTAQLRALTRAEDSLWCDDVRTPALESCAELAATTLESTLAELVGRYGEDPAAWRWGKAHEAISEHRPFGKQPFLARVFDLRVPAGGDAATVNAGRHNPWDETAPFADRWGPSLRALYDLAEPDRSKFMISSGQSGHVLSPQYGDLALPWSRNEYLPMVSSPAAVERAAVERLELRPRR